MGLFSLVIINNTMAQNGPPWKPSGNNSSAGDFLGTTNNIDLPFKTNSNVRFTVKANGDIIFNSLANSVADRILSVDANGKLSALNGGGLSTVLANNGIGVLQKTGNDYYLPTGNLGLGIAPSPGFKLDVIGDARISNNLYVGGGIVITDQVQAATQVKGWDFKVDNNLNVTGSSSFTGATTFKSAVTLEQGLELGNSFGLKTGSTDGNGNNFLQVGKTIGATLPATPPVCPGSVSNMWWMSNYGGYISQASGGAMNASLSMWTDWINGTGHIEAQGTNNSGDANNLLINYYCGRDVGINNGSNGGNINLGGSATHSVTMFSPTKIRTYNINAFKIENPNNNKTTFYVGTNGKTIIGEKTQTGGAHTGALLTIYGKAVSTEVIVTQNNWADYVFSNNYKLNSLNFVEEYIKQNKHLPNLPSEKEIIEQGLNIGDMQKLQMEKIEELTLYIIELKKEITTLKQKINK